MAQIGTTFGEQMLAVPDVMLRAVTRGPNCSQRTPNCGLAINLRHCTGRQYAWPNQYQADSPAASEC